MNLDLTKAEIKYIARALVMLENSNNRKNKQEDMSEEIKTVITRELGEVYVLRQKVLSHQLNFKENDHAPATSQQEQERPQLPQEQQKNKGR